MIKIAYQRFREFKQYGKVCIHFVLVYVFISYTKWFCQAIFIDFHHFKKILIINFIYNTYSSTKNIIRLYIMLYVYQRIYVAYNVHVCNLFRCEFHFKKSILCSCISCSESSLIIWCLYNSRDTIFAIGNINHNTWVSCLMSVYFRLECSFVVLFK